MKVIIAGGGTGGHIYPAIAIADKIKRKHPDCSILFVGTERGLERTLVPESGYEIRYIAASGLHRKSLLKNVGTLGDFIKGSGQAKDILKEFRPDFVIGTGGYVCAPMIRAAARKGVPVFLHEQNAFPGLTNRMLEKYAEKVFISFPESLSYFKRKEKLVLTGNPVRKEFIVSGINDYRKKLGVQAREFLILSFGGSRGAERINETIMNLAEVLSRTPGGKLVHITGNTHYEGFCRELRKRGVPEDGGITVLPYTDRMHEYMFASDLVICRSGAITVAELTACGKPAILIPSPHVTANHQFFNAKAIADKGGALVIEEKDLTDEKLIGTVMRLMNHKEALNAMAKASGSLGHTDGADVIYREMADSLFKSNKTI